MHSIATKGQKRRSLPRRDRIAADGSRFRIKPYRNSNGTETFRVTGWTRARVRIRENFIDRQAAKLRQLELEAEYHSTRPVEVPRVTNLSHAHLRAAEAAFAMLGAETDADELVRAVGFWIEHGRHKVGPDDAPRLDEAQAKFETWLESESGLRDKTQTGLRHALRQLIRTRGNAKLADMTGDTLHEHLHARPISKVARDNERRALSRFFSWCIERPRQWVRVNPCATVRTRRTNTDEAPPAILTVEQTAALMQAAEADGGKMVAWFALQLFGCLRPAEASRVTSQQLNLAEREIRLEGSQTKTGRARVLPIGDTLAAWLTAYPTVSGFSRRRFREIITSARIDWVQDVCRHTGISHLVRLRDSFAEAAEIAGNSETVIRRHYMGRVTKDDSARFFSILPGTEAAQ